MSYSLPNTLNRQRVTIPRSDRWQVFQRLQELAIPCEVSQDGHLWVEITHVTGAIQLRSVVQQIMADRRELVDWLKQCLQAG
ncbi:hypothetical protein BST81_02635 [Leptolyngbya sp. 'hensonii']|uniref:Asr1405/Asl0597 family protein n=1 Tax=Leptolyngbya sp. 'hensonii' TaxID=1922337 RepID=UPI0009502BE0|nr:Asr1405/Asl0597 family protein [Leptolyngbya sp. 'hensonii']OLP19988.1 hypothetical protein BST81_02635 [Leptolyngbya sp. 'hensonii']